MREQAAFQKSRVQVRAEVIEISGHGGSTMHRKIHKGRRKVSDDSSRPLRHAIIAVAADRMQRTKKAWLIGLGLLSAATILAVAVIARVAASRFEPYIRQQAIAYLQKRFDSEVELSALHISLPKISPLRFILSAGRSGVARVEGANLVLRYKGRHDLPPLFWVKHFRFEVDLGKLSETPKPVPLVAINGLEIHVPPKGDRPQINKVNPSPGMDEDANRKPAVLIQKVVITDAELVILPSDSSKVPLRFDLHRIQLSSEGAAKPMQYDAALTNPKPPGEILSKGTFGPWVAGEPGDTPLAGNYVFRNADLGVFSGIAGTLHSTGKFDGTLDSIQASDQATVQDFRLKMAGNAVPLSTRFEVLVDGTNGNTVLKPVQARLGRTSFTTSGSIIKHTGDARRSIALDVHIPQGNLADLLRLTTKGAPFMEGQVRLDTKIEIPPLTGKVKEKLILVGQFEVSGGRFLRSTIQNQIDNLSRKGQGAPGDQEIDQVVSYMAGEFHLENEAMTFRELSFGVPGASIQLAGTYGLDSNLIDFHGILRLQAKVSQTMKGWKRWALRPIDPFFSKRGAGTFLRIAVTGSAAHPKFGLDHSDEKGKVPDRKRAERAE